MFALFLHFYSIFYIIYIIVCMNITSYMLKQETPSKETEGKAPESLPFLKPETPVETPTVIESGGPVKEATAKQLQITQLETQQLPDLPAAALGSQTQQVPPEDLEDVLGKLMAEEDLEDCLHCKIYICACAATPIYLNQLLL